MKDSKKGFAFFIFCTTGFFIVIGTGCKKEKAILPEVSTIEVTVVTPISASCNGQVISAGSTKLTEKGLCWGKSPSPTIEDSTVSSYLYPYLTRFELRIGHLTPETKYYVRAYATSEAGTSYGDELSFTTPVDLTGETGTVTAADGNIYPTIGIGSQIWLGENLKTTIYNDDTGIPLVTDNGAWNLLFTPAYCWYNNDEITNKELYGALYNWYTVNTGKLCPSGWHVPDNSEWAVLASYLGGPQVAGGKMKAQGTDYWKWPNAGATNSSGFSALPGGKRVNLGFQQIGEECIFWSSSINSSTSAGYQVIHTLFYGLSDGNNSINWGLSVRCLID